MDSDRERLKHRNNRERKTPQESWLDYKNTLNDNKEIQSFGCGSVRRDGTQLKQNNQNKKQQPQWDTNTCKHLKPITTRQKPSTHRLGNGLTTTTAVLLKAAKTGRWTTTKTTTAHAKEKQNNHNETQIPAKCLKATTKRQKPSTGRCKRLQRDTTATKGQKQEYNKQQRKKTKESQSGCKETLKNHKDRHKNLLDETRKHPKLTKEGQVEEEDFREKLNVYGEDVSRWPLCEPDWHLASVHVLTFYSRAVMVDVHQRRRAGSNRANSINFYARDMFWDVLWGHRVIFLRPDALSWDPSPRRPSASPACLLWCDTRLCRSHKDLLLLRPYLCSVTWMEAEVGRIPAS